MVILNVFLKPIQSCKPNNEKSSTHKYQVHIPASYGLYTKCFDDNV